MELHLQGVPEIIHRHSDLYGAGEVLGPDRLLEEVKVVQIAATLQELFSFLPKHIS